MAEKKKSFIQDYAIYILSQSQQFPVYIYYSLHNSLKTDLRNTQTEQLVPLMSKAGINCLIIHTAVIQSNLSKERKF